MLGYDGNWCALDVENSKFPEGVPWINGFYLSVVSITTKHTKRSWVFTHNENINSVRYIVYDDALAEIQQELNKYSVVIGHNLKHDINVLKYYGINFNNHKLFCTMVAEYLIRGHEQGRELNELALRYGLKVKDDRIKQMWDAGMNTAEIPLSILVPYCEHDCNVALSIARKQYTKMLSTGMLKLFNVQMEFMDCLSDMEINGFKWDIVKSDELETKFNKYRTILEAKLLRVFGRDDLNISSNDDLSCALYGGHLKRERIGPVIKYKNVRVQMPYVFTYKNGKQVIKVRWKEHKNTPIIRYKKMDVYEWFDGVGIKPLPKTETSKSNEQYKFYKTNKEILPRLSATTYKQRLVLGLLLKLSAIAKVTDTFRGKSGDTGLVCKVARDGCIHTNFNQAVTATGRLSSSNPNGQNLPRGNTSPIKKCIIPRYDGIMNADLSQIEWRVPAQLSQDPIMIKEINTGVDQHVATCLDPNLMHVKYIGKNDSESKRNRDNAKVFNFRMIYGGTEWGFHKDPKMPHFGIKRWREIVNGFYNKYQGLKKWQDDNVNLVISQHGKLVSPTGRLFLFPLGDNGKFDERTIKNYPVQGMAGGDILPLATVIIRKFMRKYNLQSRMILTVHDSIVFDYRDDERDRLARICIYVFTNLPRYIRQYFGIDWNVQLTGEVEVGPNYGTMKQIL